MGSPTAVTDGASGALIVNENFAAYGSQRKPSTWSGPPVSSDLGTIAGISRQGYTGQTMVGTTGLIHMNGRVMDSVTGRFLSADPYITEPGNTQNFNRYGYVSNNPLSYVDPTGYLQFCVNYYAQSPPDPPDDLAFIDVASIGLTRVAISALRVPAFTICTRIDLGTMGQFGAPGGTQGASKPPCPILNPGSAQQTGIDQVRYTDASGNTMDLSNGSRTWVTNNPNAAGAGFGLRIGSYTAKNVTSPIFANYQAGRQAAANQWARPKFNNQPSIVAGLNTYTGQKFTATSGYVQTTVSQVPGATAATPPNQLTSSQMAGLLTGQQQAETWTVGITICQN